MRRKQPPPEKPQEAPGPSLSLEGLPPNGRATLKVLASRLRLLSEPAQFAFCGNLLGQIKALLGDERHTPLRRRARRLPAYLRRVK